MSQLQIAGVNRCSYARLVEGELIGFYREDSGEKLLIPDELAEALQAEVKDGSTAGSAASVTSRGSVSSLSKTVWRTAVSYLLSVK